MQAMVTKLTGSIGIGEGSGIARWRKWRQTVLDAGFGDSLHSIESALLNRKLNQNVL